MRLWTIHPKHLDAKGLVALWREGLLAQKVLQGWTRGYRHHPQLHRFRATRNPLAAIANYLVVVHEESVQRGYQFDRGKIDAKRIQAGFQRAQKIAETRGQLLHEWEHLKAKLAVRDAARHRVSRSLPMPEHHPLFRVIEGEVRDWERRPQKLSENR